MTSEDTDWAQWFAAMARDLLARGGISDTLGQVCTLSVAAIDGCQSAGISLVHRGKRIDTPAATDTRAVNLHQAQYDLGDGPCLDAIAEQHTVQIDDLATDDRWPRFARHATAAGIRSMLCFQLFTDRDTLGALNLFSEHAVAFDETDREVGLIFASHAAVALAGAQKEAHLTTAIHTRQRIGEVCGILAERHHITTQQAFHLLVQASQHQNVPLRDLAARIVSTENANRQTEGT
jgi:transcriptional regulator with GAF, ATPase, and Fis domain